MGKWAGQAAADLSSGEVVTSSFREGIFVGECVVCFLLLGVASAHADSSGLPPWSLEQGVSEPFRVGSPGSKATQKVM